jgi:hypothetical protein
MPLLRKVILLCLVLAPPAAAQATARIDPLDPVYADVRSLIGSGLVDHAVVGQQPYTRLELAQIVRQAARGLRLAEVTSEQTGQAKSRMSPARAAFLRERLDYIRARFDFDSVEADSAGAKLSTRVRPLQAIDVDFTQAQSPTRLIPRDNGLGSINATLNPILANREGRPLVDGSNVVLGSEHLFESAHVALQLRPELDAYLTSSGQAALRGTLQTASLRFVYRNLGLDIGRESVRWGQAALGNLMTSANAPPLNQVRLANEQLLTLPWILRYLGPSKFSFFYAQLGDDQNFPDAYFVGYKASISPTSRLELGGSVYSKSGGTGAPRGSFTARIIDLFPFLDASNYANIVGVRGVFEFSDRYAGLDARLRFPSLRGLETYGEILLNDFDVRRLRSVFWEDAGHVFGIGLPRISEDGRVSGWMEFHHTGNRYYEHFQYLSGQTVQRTLIGDPLGPDANGGYASFDWHRTAMQHFSAELAVERRSNDQYMYWPVALPAFGWSRIQSRPKEWRNRLVVGWRHAPQGSGIGTLFQAGYERVQNFGFVDGDSRNNFLARAGLEYSFR